MSEKAYKKIYIIVAVVSWLLLTTLTIYASPKLGVSIAEAQPLCFFLELSFLLFVVSVLLYFRTHIRSKKSEEFSKILYKLFLRGVLLMLGTTLVWVGVDLIFGIKNNVAQQSGYLEQHYLINVLNNISLIATVLFVAHTFYVFKEMIAYQTSKVGFYAWRIFESAIYLSLPLIFIPFDFNNKIFICILSFYFVFSLVLSVNQNWIVYFSLAQKWKSIIMTFLILAISLCFIYLVYRQSTYYNSSSNDIIVMLPLDLLRGFPLLSLFAFIITYCASSILVILFNLPISSAFERKFNETMNFQQLNNMVQTGGREQEIYPILLERSISIVMADAAWLDIYDDKNIDRTVLTNHIDKSDIRFIKVLLERRINLSKTNVLNLKSVQDERVKAFVAQKPYKSLLYIPLSYGYEIIGELVLVRGLFDGFDKQLIDSVKTYADQAVSSIINSRLVHEAVENQRYQEEKKIAQDVKAQLIQEKFPSCNGFEIAALTKSSGDVGGDYFDFAELGENLYALAIADVSGSGITAAFNMAQLRGIFKTLVLLSKETPTDFIADANRALSNSLAKTSFITLSLFFINTESKKVRYVRAGHCPSILFKEKTKKIEYLNDKGLGLGILRTDEYKNYISEGSFSYDGDDTLVLFTDGLIELRNKEKEEFGYDNFSNVISENVDLSPKELIDEVFKSVIKYQGHDQFLDDLSCLVVRFNDSK